MRLLLFYEGGQLGVVGGGGGEGEGGHRRGGV